MARAYLSLGCNVGDCDAGLARAVELLAAAASVEVVAVSSVYLTEPVGMKEQPDFFNIAVGVDTGLAPLELLELCAGIESQLGGREGRVSMGPRTMDVDILLYGQLEMEHDDLSLPHPRMADRAFVMAPLAEIAPDFELPGGGTVREVQEGLDDPHAVRRLGKLKGHSGGKAW